MGMNLSLKTEQFAPAEDQSWLASAHGTQEMDSITLDAATTTTVFADGVVPSGTPLTRRASGRYSPSIDNGAGVDDVVDGHLFTTVDLTAGGKTAAANTPASLQWHGEVILARIPSYAGRTDLAVAANRAVGFRYV